MCQRIKYFSIFLFLITTAAMAIDTSDLKWSEGQIPQVAAHRGGPSIGLPENTIATLKNSYSFGVKIFEIDVRMSVDGELVLFHDNSLKRLYGESGRFKNTPYSALKDKPLKDFRGQNTSHKIATLREALEWVKGTDAMLTLDLKTLDLLDPVKDMAEQVGVTDKVILIAYKQSSAILFQGAAPWVYVSAPFKGGAPSVVKAASEGLDLSRTIAWLGTKEVDETLVTALHSRGIITQFGTLRSKGKSHDQRIFEAKNPCLYLAFIQSGVDIIATDRPRTVDAVITGKKVCN